MKLFEVLDLTEPFVPGENITASLQDDLPVYLGHECLAYDLAIRSHTGTYFETSAHVFRDGKNTDEVEPHEFLYDACVIRVGGTRGSAIDATELSARAGGMKKGDALLVATSGMRDRYFTNAAAEWMAESGVRLLGAELERYDTGFVNPTGFFITLFRAEIPIVANLTNWDKLREGRWKLIVLPLLVRGVCTVPARVIAFRDEETGEDCSPGA